MKFTLTLSNTVVLFNRDSLNRRCDKAVYDPSIWNVIMKENKKGKALRHKRFNVKERFRH